ncbi:MAG: NAD(P)/FAD-dependent oxidoreductase [Acidimicrobiia bacterium]|nr:NAD(P)/FAD-dependent oxidoreductase [Acidimicrobiia bacterium]
MPVALSETADVVVLGLGPGGEHVAGELAASGLDVVGIDHRLVGGECPYWGCVPTKMMLRASRLLAEGARIGGIAGSASVEPSWDPVATRIREEATDDWDDTVAVKRLEDKGGRFVRGRGRLVGPCTVDVDGQRFTAQRGVVIATGTVASIPPMSGMDDVEIWTNHDAVETTTVPDSLLILGGGAVGVEFAQVFARFGSRVTVVEAETRLLPGEEPEAGVLMADVLASDEVDVRVGSTATRVRTENGGVALDLENGDSVRGEKLLVAVGRHADLDAIGVDTVGLDITSDAIDVDERMRAGEGLWAVGDVTGHGGFTHVSMYQANIAIADILGRPHHNARYEAVPRVTFTDPEVGSVGVTEAEARDGGLDVGTGTALVPSTARGWIHKSGNRGFIKLIVDRHEGVLVGATSVGPVGGEVLGMLTLAIHTATPVADLRTMIYAYPTFHRGVEDALRDLDG